MNLPFLRDLALLTLRDPAMGARSVMALNLGREALWTALLLAVVLNTAMMTLQNIIIPPDPGAPLLFTSTGLYFAVMAGGQVLFIYGLHIVGGWFNGRGSLGDVMTVSVWLLALQVILQAVVLVLFLLSPLLAILLNFAAMLYGLYILLHFVDQAHQLNSLLRAAVVLISTLLAIAVALSIFLSLAGGTVLGTMHV